MPDSSGPQSGNFLSDFLQRHPLPAAVTLVVATAGVAWGAMQALYVSPRDFQIAQLRDQNADLNRQIQDLKTTAPGRDSSPAKDDNVALPETGVAKGTSVTTLDGRCTIGVRTVIGDQVSLLTTLDSEKPKGHEYLPVGSRVTLHAGDVVYFIDIHRVRGDIVDLSVYRQKEAADRLR
jgi:hypothetical protein